MGLTTKIHLICASEKFAVTLHLYSGNNHDAPEGRKLIKKISSNTGQYLLMDRAYEDNKTCSLALNQGFRPIVPPKKNVKNLEILILNYINLEIKLNVFFYALSVSVVFLLVMINLILLIFLLFYLL